MDVRAILFDVFGTVVDWRGSLVSELSTWGKQRGLTADWEGLVDAWRGAYIPSMDKVRRGELPWTKLDDLHLASLQEIGPRFGLSGLGDADLRWVNHGWHRLRPWPDALPGLRKLREHFVLSPLSNGNVSLLVDMARNAGLPWDLILCAEVFGHYKPDPETYRGACRLLSLEPAQVMLCAAHNTDLAAAQRQGLRTAFIARPTEYGPDQDRDLEPEGDWDLVATDMTTFAAQMTARLEAQAAR